jgi:ribosomal protein S18 acetylase RimI-like enzyme
MSIEIQIRPYRLPDDIEALARTWVESAAYHEAIDDLPPLRSEASMDYARKRFGRIAPDDPRGLFVAEVGGEVVGHVEVRMRRDDDLNYVDGYVEELAVAEPWRGRGVGTALMAHAEQWAKDNGALSIGLDHLHTNAGAQRLYERLGYGLRGIQRAKRF